MRFSKILLILLLFACNENNNEKQTQNITQKQEFYSDGRIKHSYEIKNRLYE